MKIVREILLGLVLRAVMLPFGILWAIAQKARSVWKSYKNKSKHY